MQTQPHNPTTNEAVKTGYVDLLKSEFEARCGRNPHYSLRAFARDLDLLPSRLSDVFNGKQGLSARSATGIAKRLGYGMSETKWFVTLVESQHARSRVRRTAAEKALTEMAKESFTTLEGDRFALIAEWYHFPILELTTIDGFVSEKDWIARRLGISPIQAERAIERLISVGLLKSRNGKLTAVTTFPASTNDVPSSAIKQFHTAILEKAAKALFLERLEQREFSANMFAVDTAELPKIKTDLRKFRRDFEARYKKSPRKNEVFCLSMQFFSLTQGGGRVD